MKLFSLSVLTLLSALSVQAAVTVVAGNVYDVGKGSYSSDGNVTESDKADTLYCWAATAANVFQHWQDSYLTEEEIKAKGIPDGIIPEEQQYTYPGGTQYLAIYQDFLGTFQNKGGLFSYAVDWYFNGKTGTYLNTGAGSGGYLPGKVESTYYVYNTGNYTNAFKDLAGLKKALDAAFQYEGVAVYLGIKTPGGHAITCWGYETDGEGALTALFVTDSDDRQYGARRVELGIGSDGKITLSSPFEYGSYSSGTYTVNEVSMLIPQTGTTFTKKTANPTLDALPEGGLISGAQDITGKQLTSGSGVTTKAESMLVASGSNKDTSLTIGGEERAAGDGLTASAGSLISLNGADVSVSNFTGTGISVDCEVTLNNGSVSVTNNGGHGINLQGTEANPKAFLQMKGNSEVVISGNAGQEGAALRVGTNPIVNGKGLYTDGSHADISGNGKVVVSGNNAGEGSVMYNAGSLTIEGNGSVSFSGNTAKYDIYNEGKLTLVANEGQSITFEHGVKNSAAGTASLSSSGSGSYTFSDGHAGLTLESAVATIGAGGGILLADGKFSITDTVFTSGSLVVDFGYYAAGSSLTMTNVTLATGASISLMLDLDAAAALVFSGAEGSTLTQTVIKLTDYISLSGTELAGVDMSLTVAGQLADGTALVIDTGNLMSDEKITVTGYELQRTADGKLYYKTVPEPATATLSLLTLAALATRRRRK